MAIFELRNGKLDPVKSIPFKLEKDIQSITEENLDVVFGLEFVQTEFVLNEFRIDTLAFDKQANAFVIIEYKKDKNFSVIDQGYAYLSLMLNNKADFVLKYNENSKERLRKDDADWSQSRILFISPSFTAYQRQSVNFKDLPIELWEIKRFSNNIISYNKIKAAGATESIKTISKRGKAIENVGNEIKVYIEDKLLERTTSRIKDAYLTLKEEIYQIDSSIEQKITKTMICYSSGGKGLAWFGLHGKRLRLYLRKGTYTDKYAKLNLEGWGGYPELSLKEDELDIEHMEYMKDLVRQAYEKQ